MAVSMQEPRQENTTDSYPLLMEPEENNENHEHLIDIERGSDASSSGSSQNGSPRGSALSHHEDRPSSSIPMPIIQPPSSPLNGSNSRSSPTTRRGEGSGRRRWNPFNTVLWLSIELVFTLAQIIAAIVVLAISGHEKPQTPLFAWIVGYAVGCAVSLPIIYWRYLYRNQGTEQGSTRLRQGSAQGNTTSVSSSYLTISLDRNTEAEAGHNTSSGNWNGQRVGAPNARLSVVMDQLKMALDCFFAVWFVVGNVWIFGGHSSSSDAPNLYRLCIVFLTFSCIGYAMPFILCSMICCCLPCIISILGVRDDMNGMRGATEETINALPTHKFKSKEKESHNSGDSSSGIDEGGFVAAGTEKERVISGEDAVSSGVPIHEFHIVGSEGSSTIPSFITSMGFGGGFNQSVKSLSHLAMSCSELTRAEQLIAQVCCICLATYADNDELRELPCSHFFHTQCVDKWLKINASCPLCKFEIGNTNRNSPPPADSTLQV